VGHRNLALEYDWIFLVDADEALTPSSDGSSRPRRHEYRSYYISLRMYFIGRLLRTGVQVSGSSRSFAAARVAGMPSEGSGFVHGDMEIHEHVVVEGATARLRTLWLTAMWSRSPAVKHDEYSNWEARCGSSENKRATCAVVLHASATPPLAQSKFMGLRAHRCGSSCSSMSSTQVLDAGLIYCGFRR
jgi:hypothetical protein